MKTKNQFMAAILFMAAWGIISPATSSAQSFDMVDGKTISQHMAEVKYFQLTAVPVPNTKVYEIWVDYGQGREGTPHTYVLNNSACPHLCREKSLMAVVNRWSPTLEPVGQPFSVQTPNGAALSIIVRRVR